MLMRTWHWLQIVALALVLTLGVMALNPLPVFAEVVAPEALTPGADQPAQLFEVHCVGCHPNGGNIIRRGKNLTARALKRYGYDDVNAVADIINHGKGVMSAYGDRLMTDEIQSLAAYVLEQAKAGW